MTVPTAAASFLEVKSRMLPALALAVLAAGCSSGSPVSQRSLAVGVENAPPPPRGALVLGGESGSRAVALAVGKGRLTATVLSPSGAPLSGLKVSFRAGSRLIPAKPCGLGCYSAAAAPPQHVELRLSGSRPVAFDIPDRPRPAAAIVARAGRVTRALKSLVYVESLRSGPTGGLLTTWSMKAPNEVEYRIRGGADAIVLGTRRWDRDGAGKRWRRSQQLPALRVPQPAWGSTATNAYVLGEGRVAGRPVWVVSFANPTTPAWFTAWIDRATYRPLRMRMTAAAHFMTHRYLAFNQPLTIAPPR
jgi:copper transport protein